MRVGKEGGGHWDVRRRRRRRWESFGYGSHEICLPSAPVARCRTSSALFTAARPVGFARNSSTSSVLPANRDGWVGEIVSRKDGGSGLGTPTTVGREGDLCGARRCRARTGRCGDVQQRPPVLVLPLELGVELIGGKLREVRRVALRGLLLRHRNLRGRAPNVVSANRWTRRTWFGLGSGSIRLTECQSRDRAFDSQKAHFHREKITDFTATQA